MKRFNVVYQQFIVMIVRSAVIGQDWSQVWLKPGFLEPAHRSTILHINMISHTVM